MFSFIALTCWLAAIVFIGPLPVAGAALAGAGIAAAVKAQRRRDDAEGLFGAMLLFVLVVNAGRFVAWLVA